MVCAISEEFLQSNTFLFGRREAGDVFRPLGEMNFGPNQLILSYCGKALTYWRIQDGNLELLDEQRRPTIVFSWSADFDGREVLTGIFRLDGQQLYLVRKGQRKLGDLWVHYLISTHPSYLAQTLPSLLREMRRQGIEPERIRVTVNDSHTEWIETADGIRFSYVTHNSHGLGPLIDSASADCPADYSVLLHDTCILGSTFRHKVESIEWFYDLDFLWFAPDDPNLLGIYSNRFLQRERSFLEGLKNLPLAETRPADLRGWFTNYARSYSYLLPKLTRSPRVLRPFGGAERSETYFPAVDLYKYSSVKQPT